MSKSNVGIEENKEKKVVSLYEQTQNNLNLTPFLKITYFLPPKAKEISLTLVHTASDTTYSTLGGGGGGGGIYAPPLDYQGKKGFCPIPFARSQNYQKQGYTQKTGLYLKKKNGSHFKNRRVRYARQVSKIFCIFYLFTLKWLQLGQFQSQTFNSFCK